MTFQKIIELLSSKEKEMQDWDLKLFLKCKIQVARGRDIDGPDRIRLGKLYKKFLGAWPYEQTKDDIERRKYNTKLIVEAIDSSVSAGILQLEDSEKQFIKRTTNKIKGNIAIEQKDFNFLFYLSKKYQEQLVSFMPVSKPEGKGY